MLASSDAPEGMFSFAELTRADKCHFSFSTDKHNSINVQISATAIPGIIENLSRLVRKRDNVQHEKAVALQDRVDSLTKQLEAERLENS